MVSKHKCQFVETHPTRKIQPGRLPVHSGTEQNDPRLCPGAQWYQYYRWFPKPDAPLGRWFSSCRQSVDNLRGQNRNIENVPVLAYIEREEGITNPLFTISPCLSKPVHIVCLQFERAVDFPAHSMWIQTDFRSPDGRGCRNTRSGSGS